MIKHNAVVTGADRGLGLALAEGLLARGWRVFAGSYMPDWPQLGQLEERYPDLLVRLPLDVSSDASVLAAAAAVEERTRGIDLLINNAGVITDKSEDSIRVPQDYEDILRVYQVNSLGPVRMTEAFLPLLERGLSATLRPEELRAAGVVTGTALPAERLYGLIDLQNGAEPTEYWVANDNFFAITKYNRSYFYAMSVIDLGYAVRAARAE